GSLADLVEEGATVVIAAGAQYIEALDQDLRAALDADVDNDRLSVISAGTRAHAALLPVDGRLRRGVGGTDAALNARGLAFVAAAAHEHDFRRSGMTAVLEDLARNSPPTDRSVGRPAPNAEIIQQINGIRSLNPKISRTRVLAKLRQGGTACEQSRFASL